MTPQERRVLKIVLGSLLGAAWSLAACMMFDRRAIAVFPAGIATGLIVTWLLTRTKLNHPILLGIASLPVGMMTFGLLLGTMHLLLHAALGFEMPAMTKNPFTLGFVLVFASIYPPFAAIFLPAAIGSTYVLAVFFRERNPRRNDLLPERWDA
jgi:hypothetical protein